MVTIVKGSIGYVEEITYAVREVPTEFRRFGNEIGDFPIPSEKTSPLVKMLSSGFIPTLLKYDEVSVEFSITYQLLDGKELSYFDDIIASGDTTTGDPRYRHTISPVIPSAAYTLPSRTIHIELYEDDGTFIEAIDIAGCLEKSIEIKHVIDDAMGVIITETFIGQRVINASPTTNLLGAITGTVLDAESVQGANFANSIANASRGSAASDSVTDSLSFVFRTAVGYATTSQGYKISKATTSAIDIGATIELTTNTDVNYGTVTAVGTDLTPFYKGFGIKIDFTYSESRPNRSGTNNYGANMKPYIMNSLLESINIGCNIQLDTDNAALDLMLDSFKKTTSNTIYIRVEKFNEPTDWVAFCFAPLAGGTTYNIQVDVEGIFPFLANSDYYTFNYSCKDISIIVGNDFSILRALS